MKIGYKGPRTGMTSAQRTIVTMLVVDLDPTEVHHGDCIGGDEEFDTVCRGRFKRVAHPPTDSRFRAWCDTEEALPPKPYLARDEDIAQTVDALIAAPRGCKEMLCSGTWATIRYARKAGIPRYIVFPDGSIERELD